MEDLTAASVEDVKAFFRTYYAPGQRDAGHRGRLRSRQDQAAGRAVLRSHPAPASRSRGGRRAEVRLTAPQAHRDGGEDPAAAALRLVPDAGELRARRSRAGSARPRARRRQVVAPLQAAGLRAEDRAVGDRRASRASCSRPASRSPRRRCPATRWTRSWPSSTRRSRRCRPSRSTRPSWTARRTSSNRTPCAASRACWRAPSACSRTTTWSAIPASSTEDLRRYRAVDAAAIQRAAQQYLKKDARVVVTIDPNPDAPIMGRIKK